MKQLDHLVPQSIALSMRQEPKIWVHLSKYTILFHIREQSWITESVIDSPDEFIKIPFCPLPRISPPWFDKSPKEQYSLGDMLEIYLARMESESESLYQELSDNRNTWLEIFSVCMNENEVIHISPITFYFQSFLHKSIKFVHIDVCKELTREIPDRETTSFFSIKQALIVRQSYPVNSISGDLHSLSYIREDDNSGEIGYDLLLIWIDISHNHSLNFLPQYLPIDTHEKSWYI